MTHRMINEDRLFSNFLKNLGEKDTMIEELVENARRAKATKIDFNVNIENNTVVVSNDGEVLDDFSKLLVLADSQYDEEICLTENPAGMGMYLIMSTATSATFVSGRKRLTVDTERIFTDTEYRNTVLNTVEVLENSAYEGFETTLVICDNISIFKKYLPYEVGTLKYNTDKVKSERLENYLDIDISFNGVMVKKKELDFFVEKEGTGILEGIKFGIPMNLDDTFGGRLKEDAGTVFWHGKKINVPEIHPFAAIISNNHTFTPKLPERSVMTNTKEELENICREMENQLHEDIQKALDSEVKDHNQSYKSYRKDSIKNITVDALKDIYNTDGLSYWGDVTRKEIENSREKAIIFPSFDIPFYLKTNNEETELEAEYLDLETSMIDTLNEAGVFFLSNGYVNTHPRNISELYPSWLKTHLIEEADPKCDDVGFCVVENSDFSHIDLSGYRVKPADKITFCVGKVEREVSLLLTYGDIPSDVYVPDIKGFEPAYKLEQYINNNSEDSPGAYSYDELCGLYEEDCINLQNIVDKKIDTSSLTEAIERILESEGKSGSVKSVTLVQKNEARGNFGYSITGETDKEEKFSFNV